MLKCSIDDCKGKAKYQCPDCGQNYCDECASNLDYECDCVEPVHLVEIPINDKRSKSK
jgi:hypothetical protein